MKKVFTAALCIGLFFSGCGKKQDKRALAHNYYMLSTIDLEEDQGAHVYKKALAHIDLALEQAKNAQYLARKATILFLLNRQEESLACFNALLTSSLSPQLKAEIINNYACVLAKAGETQRALQLFEELEQSTDYLTPEVVLVNQGKIHFQQGNIEKAKEMLSRAARIAHDYVDAHYYLASICYMTKDYEQARQEAQTVVFLAPEHTGARELISLLSR